MKNTTRTTIGLKRATQEKLDKARALGQCYDGFLCQLIEMWEVTHQNGSNPSKGPVEY